MVRVPRLLPVGALALLASGLVTGLAGAVVGSVGLLSATVAQAQEAQPNTSYPAYRSRRVTRFCVSYRAAGAGSGATGARRPSSSPAHSR